MLRRISTPALLLVSLAALALAVALGGCTTNEGVTTMSSVAIQPSIDTSVVSVTSTTRVAPITTEQHAQMSVFATYNKGARNPLVAQEKADVVVYGKVTKVDPGRWNSPDGEEWQPTSETDCAVIYRVIYVQPEEVLKGSPKWGTPVAFVIIGGTEGLVDGPVTIGEQVLVIARALRPGEQLLGNVTWPKEAYFALHNEFSVFSEQGGVLGTASAEKSSEWNSVDLPSLRAAIARSQSASVKEVTIEP